jgi:transcriptional regulator with XRE-family HTH domain
LGLSVEALAERIDGDAAMVWRWERDLAAPDPQFLPALRDALMLTPPLKAEPAEPSSDPGFGLDAEIAIRVEGREHLVRTGKSLRDLVVEVVALDLRLMGVDDPRDGGDVEQWLTFFDAIPDSWSVLSAGDRIVGHWHFVPLTDLALARLLAGDLRDGAIGWDDIDLPLLPGRYRIYLTAMELDPPWRIGRPFQMLIESLIDRVERLARTGVFFREVVAAALTVESRKLCERFGLVRIGSYGGDPSLPIYVGPIEALLERPELRRRDALRALYAAS